jgi:hypothetical protein
MLALSDNQLAIVLTAADKLAPEKRGLFLEPVVARLSLLPRFTAAEFDDAVPSTSPKPGVAVATLTRLFAFQNLLNARYVVA